MKRDAHLAIGTIAFFAYTYLRDPSQSEITGYAFIYAFIAAISGSIIPDILEPPTNWAHRGLFHSKRILKITGTVFLLTALMKLYIVSSFFLGYASHLLADATTKAGLPD